MTARRRKGDDRGDRHAGTTHTNSGNGARTYACAGLAVVDADAKNSDSNVLFWAFVVNARAFASWTGDTQQRRQLGSQCGIGAEMTDETNSANLNRLQQGSSPRKASTVKAVANTQTKSTALMHTREARPRRQTEHGQSNGERGDQKLQRPDKPVASLKSSWRAHAQLAAGIGALHTATQAHAQRVQDKVLKGMCAVCRGSAGSPARERRRSRPRSCRAEKGLGEKPQARCQMLPADTYRQQLNNSVFSCSRRENVL
jgi:hypothetical protein